METEGNYFQNTYYRLFILFDLILLLDPPYFLNFGLANCPALAVLVTA